MLRENRMLEKARNFRVLAHSVIHAHATCMQNYTSINFLVELMFVKRRTYRILFLIWLYKAR